MSFLNTWLKFAASELQDGGTDHQVITALKPTFKSFKIVLEYQYSFILFFFVCVCNRQEV